MNGNTDISAEINNLLSLIKDKYIIENAFAITSTTYIDLIFNKLNVLDFNQFDILEIKIASLFSDKSITVCINAKLLEHLIDNQKLNSILNFIERKDIEQSLFE